MGNYLKRKFRMLIKEILDEIEDEECSERLRRILAKTDKRELISAEVVYREAQEGFR